MTWSEGKIGRVLARSTFDGHLCVLPNCTWTGHEIDMLVVSRCLRIIDVEIKISRADLKADKHKSKWWHQPGGIWSAGKYERPAPVPKAYPPRTWKHYYAMPAAIWRDDLLEHVQPVSGVLLLDVAQNEHDVPHVRCIKRATPDRSAYVLTAGDVVQIARLASLRMWDAYKANEEATANS